MEDGAQAFDQLRRRCARTLRGRLKAAIRDAARRYVRTRDLPGLLPVPLPAGRAMILRALRREARRQRALLRRGSWRGCPIRYRLTLAALLAEAQTPDHSPAPDTASGVAP